MVQWLAEELTSRQIDVDQLDTAGNTPLHLAAKRGQVSIVSILLNHGAQVGLKNELGLKPFDFAKLKGQDDCAEFLLLYEVSLSMSSELSESRVRKDQAVSDLAELSGHFREVLSIGKQLTKERDEMCKELRKLYEATIRLNADMRQRLVRMEQDDTVFDKECDEIQDRWQGYHKEWFSSTLGEVEHKLLVADDLFRRVRNRDLAGPGIGLDKSYPQRHLRDRMEEIRSASCDISSLQRKSSSVAAASLFTSSDSEGDIAKEDTTDSLQKKKVNIAQRKKLPTPSPSRTGDGAPCGSKSSLDDSLYSSLSNEVYSQVISTPIKMAASPLKSNRSPSKLEKSRQRQILRQKLKECALTSESGTASVLEVIEPTSSEDEGEDDTPSRWPRTIFPSRNEDPSSMIAITSASSSFRASDSSQVMFFQRKKKIPSTFQPQEFIPDPNCELQKEKKPNFLQKIASKTKFLKKSPRSSQEEVHSDEVEEHILPDSFDDDLNEFQEERGNNSRSEPSLPTSSGKVDPDHDQPRSLDSNRNKIEKMMRSHKSLSPGSRRTIISKSGSVSAASVATSDSGIGIFPTSIPTVVLSKIDEASIPASAVSSAKLRRNMSIRAWYDVPYEEDIEAPEADSLASIISNRSSSNEELYK